MRSFEDETKFHQMCRFEAMAAPIPPDTPPADTPPADPPPPVDPSLPQGEWLTRLVALHRALRQPGATDARLRAALTAAGRLGLAPARRG